MPASTGSAGRNLCERPGNKSVKLAASVRPAHSTPPLRTTAASKWLVSSFQTGVDPRGRKRHEYHGERHTAASTRLSGVVMAVASLQSLPAGTAHIHLDAAEYRDHFTTQKVLGVEPPLHAAESYPLP